MLAVRCSISLGKVCSSSRDPGPGSLTGSSRPFLKPGPLWYVDSHRENGRQQTPLARLDVRCEPTLVPRRVTCLLRAGLCVPRSRPGGLPHLSALRRRFRGFRWSLSGRSCATSSSCGKSLSSGKHLPHRRPVPKVYPTSAPKLRPHFHPHAACHVTGTSGPPG